MQKILTVIGTRPQLIKYDNKLEQVLVWTGQHYDKLLSDVFFKGLKIPKPDYSLGETELGEMITAITPILLKEKPDYVMVYGDCRSTLAGATAAYYLKIPIIHVEAGCRSYNDDMVEERIRKSVDNMATICFTPSERSKNLLMSEGKTNVMNVGATQIDTMFSTFPTKKPKNAYKYRVMTLHRDYNVDNKESLERIMRGVAASTLPVEFYCHPRTRENLKKFNIKLPDNVEIKEPLGYKAMINKVAFAEKVLTDSGGLQVETFSLRRPCMTLRNETEWQETVDQGWNLLVGSDDAKITGNINRFWRGSGDWEVYGRAKAKQTLRTLLNNL